MIYVGLAEVRWEFAEAQLRTWIKKLIGDGVVWEERDRYTLVV